MKNILVPTDFSPEAHYAYEVALQLAQHTGGSVTLLHVLEELGDSGGGFSSVGGPVGGGGLDQIFPIKLIEATKYRLQTLQEEAQIRAEGVPVQHSLKTGAVSDSILRAIQKYGIDLVVMGARAHGGLQHLFVSSHAEQMIRLAPCPVLTVKHEHAQFEVRNIVFPFDFSGSPAGALDGLRQVQAVFPQARLHLLHVLVGHQVEPSRQQEQIQRFALQHRLTNWQPAVVEADRPSTGIEQYAHSVQSDWVVMPTHGRSGLSTWLRPSVAEAVATHAFPPVMTYHFQ
ncbi:universal stress protein [Hymenobacter sp. BT683]|uniref:Universal stress protein n=1 Tax=Hymenobacter jeongseonensis TaxID=2791027 RepID=A0ABS0ILX8_9BACT|nr:universal stress protein [Hymenobacter jeongseonensis]MBF9239365.1 universal stress protein [Hymenobacter jeongseonensis]